MTKQDSLQTGLSDLLNMRREWEGGQDDSEFSVE